MITISLQRVVFLLLNKPQNQNKKKKNLILISFKTTTVKNTACSESVTICSLYDQKNNLFNDIL